MIPKSRFSCPGTWAIMHDEQDDIGDVVTIYFDKELNEFCFTRNTGLINKVIPESSLTNLSCWCLIDHTGYEQPVN